jgi:CheY-like chemotaxis protein
MLQIENNARTALIVEDSPTQAMHLEHLLSDNGMITVWAHDSDEGMRCAQMLLPDVIIMDVFMPGAMNGLQLCKYLKANRHTHDIPIIMLTQYNTKETAEFGMRLGVVEYIPKDAFSDAVLLETLKEKGLIGELIERE